MSQTNAIDQTSPLRTLPLPGRQELASGATAPAPNIAAKVAGRSQQAESYFYVNYGPVSIAAAANTPPRAIGKAAYASGRQTLSDQVVNLLLQSNEVETAAPATAPPSPSANTRYASASNGFPRSNDSLFSIVS